MVFLHKNKKPFCTIESKENKYGNTNVEVFHNRFRSVLVNTKWNKYCDGKYKFTILKESRIASQIKSLR